MKTFSKRTFGRQTCVDNQFFGDTLALKIFQHTALRRGKPNIPTRMRFRVQAAPFKIITRIARRSRVK